mgnify:CR=1 FL=1
MDAYSENTSCDRRNGFRLITDIKDSYLDSSITSTRVTTYSISENGNTKYSTEVINRTIQMSPRLILSVTLEDAIITHFNEVEDLRRNFGRRARFSEIKNWVAVDFTLQHEGERREGIS